MNSVALMLLVVAGAWADEIRLSGRSPEEAFGPRDGALVRSAIDGDGARIDRSVGEGANPNSRSARGESPLAWVMVAGNHAGMRRLLALGADPNALLVEGKSGPALWEAVRRDDVMMVRILLAAKADPNGRRGCRTVLQSALSFDGDVLGVIRELVKAGANVDATTCNTGVAETAVAFGRFDVVHLLLQLGYRVRLDELAESAASRFVPAGTEAHRDKVRVIGLLRARGISVPVVDERSGDDAARPREGLATAGDAAEGLGRTRDIGCAGQGRLDNQLNAVDLVSGARACADRGDYARAAVLFSLGGAYARFDMKRVRDNAAHQAYAGIVLRVLSGLSQTRAKALDAAIGRSLNEPSLRAAKCVEAERLGYPHYHPSYMIRHGISAVGGQMSPLVEPFDPQSAWDQVMRSYLRCTTPAAESASPAPP